MMTQLTFKSKILWGLAAILVCGGFVFWKTNQSSKSFSPSKVCGFLSYNPDWDVPFTQDSQQTLTQVFKQPFMYLASGVQTFAFVSQDGKYVIKFFRSPFLDNMEKSLKRKDKLVAALNAYHMAYEEIPKDTGLLFVHLNRKTNLQKTVMVSDRSGKKHLIDLDEVPFIVQEKAELIFDYLKQLVIKGDARGLKKSVTAVLDLVERRIQKGFTDDDRAVTHNYGFVGDRPIHFDIGRLHKGKRDDEYEHIAGRIDSWLLQDAEK
jgi:hypothetical protein